MAVRWFSEDEFACKCGCGKVEMVPAFVDKVDDIFTFLGWDNDRLLSGYRCPSHEKAIGGTGSNHPKGFAVDVAVMTGQELKEFLRACFWKDIRRVLIYKGRGFCHIDDNMDKPESVIIM